MKKVIGCTLMALILTADIWGDPVKPGLYVGIQSSIQPDRNGREWRVTVKFEKGYNIANAELENAIVMSIYTEQWIWNENTFQLIEQNKNIGMAGMGGGPGSSYIKKYGARYDDGKYIINCKNRELGDCDGGKDPNHYWKIIANEDGFIWESWGVPQGATGDPVKMDWWTFKPTYRWFKPLNRW